MTTLRTHNCNLCHMALRDDPSKTPAIGIHHGNDASGPRIDAKPPRDAENHLCGDCIKALKRLFASACQ
jgi:hypothetical protein